MIRPLLALCLTFTACSSAPKETKVANPAPNYPSLFEGQGNCEEYQCAKVCSALSCLGVSPQQCQTECRRQCGNGFFDLANEEFYTCIEQSSDRCESAADCCSRHFTTTLCLSATSN